MKHKLLLSLVLSFWILGLYVPASYSQTPDYTCTIVNDSIIGGNVYEFDIYLLRLGTNPFELGGAQFGFLYDDAFKNGGTMTASMVPGSVDSLIVKSGQTNVSFQTTVPGCVKVAPKLAVGGHGTGAIISNIAPGSRVGRLRLTNSVAFSSTVPNFKYSFNIVPYATKLSAYIGVTNTEIQDSTKFLIKLKHVINGIQPDTKILPTSYAVYQNFPNPFNPSTIISYAIKERGFVKMTVYDILGKMVKVLVNESKEQGNYQTEFNAKGLASGIYIYRIEVTGKGSMPVYSDIKKMILLK